MSSFPTTRWANINIVRDRTHPEHRQELDRFVRDYSSPVFAFLRAYGQSPHDAEDLTQEFFTRFVCERDWVASADQQKGRFRNFLCVTLKRFLADYTTNRAARQIQFEREQHLSIQAQFDDENRNWEPAAGETPEEAFDRRWARAVMEKVRGEFRRRCEVDNHPEWAVIYETYHASEIESPGQEELAGRFSMSRDQVRGVLEKGQKLFDRLLRQEIRDQVGSEEEIDDEIRDLFKLLTASSS